MDKLTAIKIKYDDGTYSDEIPVSVLSENVEWDNTHTLVDVLGSIDVDVTGTIQDQISQLFNEKVSVSALNTYVANQLNTDVVTWLQNNVDPVGSAVVVDKSLTIEGAAADAKTVGDLINNMPSDLENSLNRKANINDYFDLKWTTGKAININGVYNIPSCSATLDYYKVNAGDILKIYAYAPGTSDTIVLYDTNKVPITSFTLNTRQPIEYTVPSDGFMRFSNEPLYIPDENAYVLLTNPSSKSIQTIEEDIQTIEEDIQTIEEDIQTIQNYNIENNIELSFTNGYYYIYPTGARGNSSGFAVTQDYYKVRAGNTLICNLFGGLGTNEACVVLYDTEKNVLSTFQFEGKGKVVVTENGYARFSTKTTKVSINDAYVIQSFTPIENGYFANVEEQMAKITPIEEDIQSIKEDIAPIEKSYFMSSFDDDITKESLNIFNPSTLPLDYSYKGEINAEKRFLAIGFDDFRASDFSMVIPLFDKYGAKCVLNRVAYEPTMSKTDIAKINQVIYGGHELGDHTFYHYNFPYSLPLFNGQDPSNPEGNQTPYPTNNQMRIDVGDGKNALGYSLTASASVGNVNTAWGSLTDEECQYIREYFSIIKNATLRRVLDELSNTYLQTEGSSLSSYDTTTGKYTGGIFTGCATSANHEVWERILLVTRMYYKDQYGLNWNQQTWSWPGSMGSNLTFLNRDDNLRYYDELYTQKVNYTAKFESSLTGKTRSWNDCLRAFGYKGTHDSIYPGRWDGQSSSGKCINLQLIMNGDLSRKDGITYPTNRTVSYSAISNQYPETFFVNNEKSKAAQMYDAGSSSEFYKFIEATRRQTANGIIKGEVIDSVDSFSERVFLEEVLKYCKAVGIEVITKAQAYDICFNHRLDKGNLIYNPMLRNTAKEYMPDAENIPDTPDGYTGDCHVETIDGAPVLITGSREAYYSHFGIPFGKLKFSVDIKGSNTIRIVFLTNKSNYPLASFYSSYDVIINGTSNDNFINKSVEFYIPNNPETDYEQYYEGLANKIIGIGIRYDSGLQIKNIRLEKI